MLCWPGITAWGRTVPVLELDAMEEDAMSMPSSVVMGTAGAVGGWENLPKSGSQEDRLDWETSVSYDGHEYAGIGISSLLIRR